MKKILVGIGSLAGVAVGGLIIWNVVIPFLGNLFSGFGSLVTDVASFVTGLF